ncbi:MAG: hypothetical protein RLZZ214_3584 [Verrucomicrobiota bacterium]
MCAVIAAFSTSAHGAGIDHWLASHLDSQLPVVERRLAEISREMGGLPVLPDLDSLGTHGFHSNFTGGSEENWFEIAWDAPRIIDGIAVVPTRLTTQSGETSNYGFPASLRIEAMVPGGGKSVIVAEMKDSHLDFRRGDPVFFQIPPTEVLSLRFIPINLPKLPNKHVRFFSLSELMVFQGECDIAHEGRLSAHYSIDAEVGWNLRYLVDGQSPLGPPEVPPRGLSLGWHADLAESNHTPIWAAVDLGGMCRFDSVRLIAARGDSPVKGPGFGFPVGFRIEASATGGESSWQPLWETGGQPFTNPGYNPVTFRFPAATARYVRLAITEQHQPDPFTAPRILLSEMEVLDGLTNVALGRTITTSDRMLSRPHDAARIWSAAGLTDGFSSTGRLIPLRRWVADLSRGFDLALERRTLLAERESILTRTWIQTLTTVFSVLSAAIIGLVIWQVRLRRSGHRHIRDLRRRISSDLHDEVGSNLATIALLAEIPPVKDPSARFGDISRMARESSQSLREIVDLTLAPNRARKPLPERLREIATLMLQDHTWEFSGDATPNLDPEQRRNLVFFIKEALHNISRHARASHVKIHFEADASQSILRVSDDGCGLPVPPPAGIPRLRALEQRAESLHGSLAIESASGAGTSLTLRFPLHTPHRK